MEALHQGGDVVLVLEAVYRERYIELPHLEQIPRLDEALDAHGLEPTPAEGRGEALELGVDCREHGVHALEIEAGRPRDHAGRMLVNHVRDLHPAGAEHRGGARQDHPLAAELAGNRHGAEAGRAAARDEGALAGIEAFGDGDVLNRLDHQLVGEAHDGMRAVVEGFAELVGERADRASRRLGVEGEPAAEEVVGIEIT